MDLLAYVIIAEVVLKIFGAILIFYYLNLIQNKLIKNLAVILFTLIFVAFEIFQMRSVERNLSGGPDDKAERTYLNQK